MIKVMDLPRVEGFLAPCIRAEPASVIYRCKPCKRPVWFTLVSLERAERMPKFVQEQLEKHAELCRQGKRPRWQAVAAMPAVGK